MKKDVLLLASDFINDELIDKYYRLQNSFKGDTILLLHKEDEKNSIIPNKINYRIFTIDILNKLQYEPICDTIIPGSNHFSLLWFYLNHPQYKYYWNIESDVEFSGDWRILFDIFLGIEADFISTHVMKYIEDPNWYWWRSLKCQEVIPLEDRIRSFNPIYRISNNALSFLHSFLQKGNSGHHEVLIPSVLYNSKYKILDFGGSGNFVPAGFEEKFYLSKQSKFNIDSTMRFKPIFNKDVISQFQNKLIHPLKLNI